MNDEIIPDDIRQFFLQHIDSIAQWEGLLLLRADPETGWNAEAIARRLYINQAEADEILSQLYAKGFLAATPPLYRYQADLPEKEQLIMRAAELYTQHLVPITHLIHSKAKMKVQQFADAFKIRKD